MNNVEIRAIEAITTDPKLAKFLLSNPTKNTTFMFIWLTCNGKKSAWMLIDGSLELPANLHKPISRSELRPDIR